MPNRLFNVYDPLQQFYSCQANPGRFHSTKNSGNLSWGSQWNRHFREFYSENLRVPREVGLKFRKVRITGKFRAIRPFLFAPSFSEFNSVYFFVPFALTSFIREYCICFHRFSGSIRGVVRIGWNLRMCQENSEDCPETTFFTLF